MEYTGNYLNETLERRVKIAVTISISNIEDVQISFFLSNPMHPSFVCLSTTLFSLKLLATRVNSFCTLISVGIRYFAKSNVSICQKQSHTYIHTYACCSIRQNL